MMLKKILFPLMAILIGCESTVTVDLPNQEPELVVNSVVRPDSSFWVELSNTRPTTSTNIDIRPVRDAVVKVIANDSDEYKLDLVEVANEDGSQDGPAGEAKVFYRLDSLIPETGSRYQIEVESPRYGMARASPQKVLPKPDVSITDFQYRVDFSNRVLNSGPEPYRFDVEFEVRDDPTRQNFYHIGVYHFSDWQIKIFSSADVALVSQFDDELLGGGGSNSRETFAHFASFTDRGFDGKTKKIRIRFFKTFAPGTTTLLRIELSSITADLHKYYKSRREAEERVQIRDVSLPLSEPIRIFNNIEGGHGIFGIYSPSTFIWDFDTEKFIDTPDS